MLKDALSYVVVPGISFPVLFYVEFGISFEVVTPAAPVVEPAPAPP